MDPITLGTLAVELLTPSIKSLLNSSKSAIQNKQAKIQSAAQEEFQLRIRDFKAGEQEIDAAIVERKDFHKLSEHLIREIRSTTEEAVTLNEQELIGDVLSFYHKTTKLLFASSPSKPLSNHQLSDIRAELGVFRLRVAWKRAQQSAQLKQEQEEYYAKRDMLSKKAENEKRLQKRMFGVLSIYVLVLILIISLVQILLPSLDVIPLIGIPISVFLWSVLGSIANMLYRFYKRQGVDDVDLELRWYSARPLVGIIMGIVIYLVLQAGVIFVGFATSQPTDSTIRNEILWLFSFIGGFSDRFFETIIEKVKLAAVREKGDDESMETLAEHLRDELATKNTLEPNISSNNNEESSIEKLVREANKEVS